MINYFIFLLIIFFPLPVLAYIGPGMGGGAIAVIIGFFVAFFLGLWALVYYPIKRLIKNKNKKKPNKSK